MTEKKRTINDWGLTPREIDSLIQKTTPKMTKYIPFKPHPKQAAFMLLPNKEAFYGGSAGGGKSVALLMAALQYVDVPGYRAILFRKTFADLNQPMALMDLARQWLTPWRNIGEVRWVDKRKTWIFPSGATLTFGYLDSENDRYNYQGGAFQFIGFDELTQISEGNYRYLFTRLRKPEGLDVPLRVRSTSNPGGIGHEWVKRRMLDEGLNHLDAEGNPAPIVFIPANLDDNPSLDRASYIKNLNEVDPIVRAQLLEGDWTVRHTGSMFDRRWFLTTVGVPKGARYIRYWDLAATTESEKNPDPDWTVGLLLAEKDGIYYIVDIVRFRGTPKMIEDNLVATRDRDGKRVPVFMEQEPGATGIIAIDHYARTIFKGYSFRGVKTGGKSKETRAYPASTAAEQGRIRIVDGCPNLMEFFDEIEAFPMTVHDDIVDAFAGAFNGVHEVHYNPSAIPVNMGGNSHWKNH